MRPSTNLRRVAAVIAVLGAVLAVGLSLFPPVAASGQANGLAAAWERARSAGSYSFTADIRQTLIPRAVAGNIGKREEHLNMSADGDIQLPDKSRLTLTIKSGTGASKSATVIQDGGQMYVQKGDELEKVSNVTSLAAPGGDFMAYLASATNVRVLPIDPIAYPPAAVPGNGAFTRYGFDIDGARLAEFVSEQAAERARIEAGQPVNRQALPILKQLSGVGELWVDAQGLPRHQVIDLKGPQAQDDYDIAAHVTADYRNYGPVAALSHPVAGAISPGTLFDRVRADVRGVSLTAYKAVLRYAPLTPLLLILGIFAAALVACRTKRWLYILVAVLTIIGTASSPMISSLRFARYLAVEASAAPLEPLADALGVSITAPDEAARTAGTTTGSRSSLLQEGEYSANAIEACGDGDASVDTDKDGLNDLVESCLGTNAALDDSDGDGIPDGVEAYGVMFTDSHGLTYTLTSDPLNPDSLGDGISDARKWPEIHIALDASTGSIRLESGHVATLPAGSTEISRTVGISASWDTDGDSVPNVWDADMDGDAVPNSIDVSPDAAASGFADTLDLTIQGGGFNGYKYVTLNVRPENAAHLEYPNVSLGWPLDDTAGNIQHINNPSGNYTDSLRLVPMLLIDSSSVPSTATLDQNQLIAMQLIEPDDPSRPYQMLAPLSPQSIDGANYTFASQIVYTPQDGDNIEWTVRLIWLVVAKTDSYINCADPANAGATGCRITTDTTVVQVYYDDPFRVTGFTVGKSGPTEVAIIGTPNTPTDDGDLFNIYTGLTAIFQQYEKLELQGAGATALQEVATRFDPLNTNIDLAYRWGVTNTVRVDLQTYDHRAAAGVGTGLETSAFLDSYYPTDAGAMCTGADGGTFKCTSLLVATEAREGLTDLVELPAATVNAMGAVSVSANMAHTPLFTVRSVNLNGYEYDNLAWQHMSPARVFEVVNERYAPKIPALLAEIRQTWPNAKASEVQAAYLSAYLQMMSQQMAFIQVDGVTVVPAAPDDEIQYVYDLGLAMQGSSQGAGSDGGGAPSLAGAPRLTTLAAVGDAVAKFFKAFGTGIQTYGHAVAGWTLIGAMLLLQLGSTIVSAIQGFCPQDQTTLDENDTVCKGVDAKKIDIAAKVFAAFNIILAGVAIASAALTAEKFTKAVTAVSAAATAAKVLDVIGVVLSVVAACISIAVTWYSYAMAAKASSVISGGDPFLKTMISQAVWMTILAIVIAVIGICITFLAGIALSVVWAVVMLIEAILQFISMFIPVNISISAWLVFIVGMAFYQAVILTEVVSQGFIDSSGGPTDPLKGLTQGAHFQIKSVFQGEIQTTNKTVLMAPINDTSPSAYHGNEEDLEDSYIYAGLHTDTSNADVVGVDINELYNRQPINDSAHVFTNTAGVDFELLQAKPNVVVTYSVTITTATKYVSCGLGICTDATDHTSVSLYPDPDYPMESDPKPVTITLDVLEAGIDGLIASDNYSVSHHLQSAPSLMSASGETSRLAGGSGANTDPDQDGLATDDERCHWDATTRTLGGGWLVSLPSGPAVRVCSDPNAADRDRDEQTDAVEKANRTSPFAVNNGPRVPVTARPLLTHYFNDYGAVRAVFVQQSDPVTLTLGVHNVTTVPITSTLRACVPSFLSGFNGGALAGAHAVQPVVSDGGCDGGNGRLYSWAFAGASLLPGEQVSTTITAVAPGAPSRQGSFTVALPYDDGVITHTHRILVDNEPPQVAIGAPPAGDFLRGSTYVVGGSSSDVTSWVKDVTLKVGGAAVGATITGDDNVDPWAQTWTLPDDGLYSLTASAHDYFNHETTSTPVMVTVDNTSPTVTLSLAGGAYVTPGDNGTTITLTGRVTDVIRNSTASGVARVEISLDNQPWRPVAVANASSFPQASSWTHVWSLGASAEGKHSVSLRAFDRSGNSSNVHMQSVVVDKDPPTHNLTTNPFGEDATIRAGTALTLSGRANDVGRAPLLSRPTKLEGTITTTEKATVWLEPDSILDYDDGVTVTWLGDINADGRADLAVGLPAAEHGAGKVAILHGRGGGFAIVPDAEALRSTRSSFAGVAGAGIGAMIAAAGDTNGDGYADFLVGDAINDFVYLIFGQPNDLGNLMLDGLMPGRREVFAIDNPSLVAAAGDVNGDGLADVLMGAGSKLYLVMGRTNRQWSPSIVEVTDDAAAVLDAGATLTASGVGNIDGVRSDEVRYDSFAVGANSKVYLFLGRAAYEPRGRQPLTLSATHGVTEIGPDATFTSASAVPQIAALGDATGDALADFAFSHGSAVAIVLGRTSASWSTSTTLTYAGLTGKVYAVGDANADGRTDLLLGATSDRAFLVPGTATLGSQAPDVLATLVGVSSAASAPYSAGADLNCDASADLLLVPPAVAAAGLARLELSPGAGTHVDPAQLPVGVDMSNALPATTAGQRLASGAGLSVATTRYVDDDGCTGCVTSIQTAINNATAGDTIYVYPGVYAAFTVNKAVTIQGADPDAVFVDGNGGTNVVEISSANGVRISNLTLRNAVNAIRLSSAGTLGYTTPANKTLIDHVVAYNYTYAVSMDRLSTLDISASTFGGQQATQEHIIVDGVADSTFTPAWSDTAVADATTGPNVGGVLIENGDKLYSMPSATSAALQVYDPATNGWTSLATGPANLVDGPRAVAAGENDFLYVLRRLGMGGGVSGGSATIYAMQRIGDNIYVGGSFTTVVQNDRTSLSAANIARWDGWQWSALGGGVNSTVYALAEHSGKLVVGGAFTTATDPSGTAKTVNRLAEWDPSQSVWTSFSSSLNGAVRAIAVNGNDIYVGGDFTAADYAAGLGRDWAAYKASFTSYFPNAVDDCWPDEYEASAFNISVYGTGVVRFNTGESGANWCAKFGVGDFAHGNEWGADAWNIATDVAYDPNSVANLMSSVLVGPFLNVRLFESASFADRYMTLHGCSISQMWVDPQGYECVPDEGIRTYLNNDITSITVTMKAEMHHLAKVNGTTWSSLAAGVNGTVNALTYLNGNLYIGGSFTRVGNTSGALSIPNFVVWNTGIGTYMSAADSAAGHMLTPYSTAFNFNGRVDSITTDGSKLYVGGAFTNLTYVYFPDGTFRPGQVQNLAASRVAVYNPNSWQWYPLGTATSNGVNDAVHDIVVADGKIYMAGEFTRAYDTRGNFAFPYVAAAALPEDLTTLNWDWTLVGNGVSAHAYAVEVDGDDVYAGGNFVNEGGGSYPVNNAMRFSPSYKYQISTNTWSRWATWSASLPYRLRNHAVGVNAGAGTLYFLGGDTTGTSDDNNAFWLYTQSNNGWYQRQTLPGTIGGGVALTLGERDGASVIYGIRGGGSTDLYVYNLTANAWTTLASQPFLSDLGVAAPWGAGAGLAWGGGGYLYALSGGSGRFLLRYRVATNAWERGPDISEIVRDGAGLARVGSYLYATVGNGDASFYRFGVLAGVIPQKLTLTSVAFVAPSTQTSPQWLRPITSTVWSQPTTPLSGADHSDDFGLAAAGVQWVGGGGAWTPAAPVNPSGSTITLTAARFVDESAAHPVYRVRSGSTLTAGYYAYHADAHVSPTYGWGQANDGYMWGQTAFSSIQSAIASGAQRVVLGPGVYNEGFYLVNGVEVFGSGADVTIIQPSGTAAALVKAEGVFAARLSKVTLNGGATRKGLVAEQGATGLLVSRNIIRNTTTGVAQDGALTDVEVANNTLVNNARGVDATACSNPDVRNTVFAYHTGSGLSYQTCATNPLHTYNAYFGNTADISQSGVGRAADGPGEIGADPLFTNAAADDYRPLSSSPLMNAGSPTDAALPGAGGRVDIGYVEVAQASFYADATFCATCDNAGLTWQIDAFASIQDAVNAAGAAARALGDPAATFSVGVGPGVYAEGVTIPSHVSLIGSGAEKTSITGGGSGAVITITAAADVEVRGFTIDNSSSNVGFLVSGASHAITLTRNIIRSNTVGIDAAAAASSVMATFNTIVTNTTAVRADGAGTWVSVRDSIFSGNTTSLQATSSGQLLSDYNLFNAAALPAGAGVHDVTGAPQFTGGDLSLTKTSPAVDAAEPGAHAPAGGGLRADMGYRELLAPPILLLFGRMGTSCAFGNSGVSSVQIGLSGPLTSQQSNQPVTATLPSTWSTVTLLGQAGDTARYWTGTLAPGSEGPYRFYARATDAVANQEKAADWYLGSAYAVGAPPVVAWVSPATGSTTTEAAIEVRAQATNHVSSDGRVAVVTSPSFKVNGVSYAAEWLDAAGVQPRTFRAIVPLNNGSNTIQAVSRDSYGNEGSAAAVTITASTPAHVATISEPFSGAATQTSAVAVRGYARFTDTSGVPRVTVIVNSTSYTATVASAGDLVTAWTAMVTLAAGSNTLSATASRAALAGPSLDAEKDAAAGDVSLQASTVTITWDTTAPSLTVSAPVANSIVTQATFTVTGTASDATGLKDVAASLDGGATWTQAALTSSSGAFTVTLPALIPADAVQISIIVRARDMANNERLVSRAVIIDNVPPAPVAATFSVAPGAHFQAPTNVTVSWPAPKDGSGSTTVRATVSQVTNTIPSSTATSPLTASFSAPGAWYVHLSAVDSANFSVTQHIGPWYVDDRTTTTCANRVASILVNGKINAGSGSTVEWNTGSELLDVDARSGKAQSLFATWDARNLYLGWRGATWASDGDLWAYVSTGAAGTTTPVPAASGGLAAAFTLPFAADYAIKVKNSSSGTLWHYAGGSWQSSALSFASMGRETEIKLPWTLGSVSNLRLLAFAVSDAGKPWAVFPTTNAVSGAWTAMYAWANPCSAAAPNVNQPQARYAGMSVTSVQDQTQPLGASNWITYVVSIKNSDVRTLSSAMLQMAASTGLGYQSVAGITCPTCGTPANPWTLALPDIAAGAGLNLTVTARLAASLTGLQAVTSTMALSLVTQTLPLATAAVIQRVDSQAPTVTLTTTDLRRGVQTIYGSATDGSGIGVQRVEIQSTDLGISSWRPVSGTVAWSTVITVPQDRSSVTINLRATDKHGLQSAVRTYTINLDITPPTTVFALPPEVVGRIDLRGAATDAGTPGSGVSTVQVQVDSATSTWLRTLGPYPAGADGIQNWSFLFDLPKESGVTHQVRARAIDGAGNVSAPTAWQLTTNFASSTDLAISKTVSYAGAAAVPGSVVTYTLVAANLGASAADGARVTDTFSSLLYPVTQTGVYTPGQALPRWTCSGAQPAGSASCGSTTMQSGDLGRAITLPVGSVVTFTASAMIDPDARGVLTNTAVVTVPAVVAEDSAANNSSTVSSTLAPLADLDLALSTSSSLAMAGGSLTYSVTVSNKGPSTARSLVVSDTLPSAVTIVSMSPGCVHASALGNLVVCNTTTPGPLAGTLWPGGRRTFTVTVAVDAAAWGSLASSAILAGLEPDSSLANNTAALTTTVATGADVYPLVTDAPDPVVAGNVLTYTMTATNNGPSNASMVRITGTVPANTTFRGADAGGGACITPAVGGTGVVTCWWAGDTAVAAGHSATVTVDVAAGLSNGTMLTFNVTAGSLTSDPVTGNNGASASTQVLAAPTPTATSTATSTATPAESPTPTVTSTATPVDSPTPTETATSTATPVDSPTPTETATSTATPVDSPTPTATSTATETSTATPTATGTATETSTATPTATSTATETSTPTPTATSTATSTSTATETSTATPTATSTATPTETPTATFTRIGTPAPTRTPTHTPYPTPIERCAPEAVLRIDLGAGAAYSDGQGYVWRADKAYTPGSWGWYGQSSLYNTDTAIAGTEDDALYQTERFWIGSGGYRVDLPNGDYKVRLHLAEIYPWARRDTRKFTVLIEGQPLLANLDIAAAVGQYHAYDVWANVSVRDGRLDLDMLPVQSNPVLHALSIYDIGWCPVGEPTATPTPGFTLRINAGGAGYTDGSGLLWLGDQAYAAGSWGALGGTVYENTAPITGTVDDVLYQSHRWWHDSGSYAATVPNGTYQVTLKFAELYPWAIAGSRVFDVRIEGVLMRANVDAMAAAGRYTAYDLTFNNVAVVDGVLTLDLLSRVGAPALNALAIVQQGGGEAPAAPATPTPTPTATPVRSGTLFQVNAGGGAYIDRQGVVWSSDQAYTQGGWGYMGGMAGSAAVAIDGTEDDVLYQSERWWLDGTGTYRFTVPNGVYDVELRFAETYFNSYRGSRVFDVKVEGQLVREGLDIVNTVGMDAALDITAPGVVVADGVLQIDLVARTGPPKLNGIRIWAP